MGRPQENEGRDWRNELTRQELPEAARGGKDPPLGSRGPPWFRPNDTDFGLLDYRTVRECISVWLLFCFALILFSVLFKPLS